MLQTFGGKRDLVLNDTFTQNGKHLGLSVERLAPPDQNTPGWTNELVIKMLHVPYVEA